MSGCPALTSRHDGVDVQLMVDPVSQEHMSLCRGCRSVAEDLRAPWIVERRNLATRLPDVPRPGLLARVRGLVPA